MNLFEAVSFSFECPLSCLVIASNEKDFKSIPPPLFVFIYKSNIHSQLYIRQQLSVDVVAANHETDSAYYSVYARSRHDRLRLKLKLNLPKYSITYCLNGCGIFADKFYAGNCLYWWKTFEMARPITQSNWKLLPQKPWANSHIIFTLYAISPVFVTNMTQEMSFSKQ